MHPQHFPLQSQSFCHGELIKTEREKKVQNLIKIFCSRENLCQQYLQKRSQSVPHSFEVHHPASCN